MDKFLALGRWLFALPFAIFGLLHFMNAQAMARLVPSFVPGGIAWIYFTGIVLIAASVSLVLGKLDKLGASLLALFLIVVVLLLHVPGAMAGGTEGQLAMTNILKDMSLAGGAMMYALHYAQDKSYMP